MARDRALTGAQKAAVFILHMGKDRSAEVLRSMRETEVAEIMAEVARMRTVNGAVIDEVVSEFKEMADAKVTITAGGLERARTLLEESLGGEIS
jgi:flagellar motor switch protein FliG